MFRSVWGTQEKILQLYFYDKNASIRGVILIAETHTCVTVCMHVFLYVLKKQMWEVIDILLKSWGSQTNSTKQKLLSGVEK